MRELAKAMPFPGEQYARDIVAGKIDACRWVKKACQRHLDDLKRQGTPDFPFIFDQERADRFLKFTRHLKHYKGPLAGKSLELLPWQQFILGSLYGWVEKDTGTFRFQQAYIEVPRKQGKSFMCAAIALYDMALLEKTGAEVYLAATKLDQSKLIYKDVIALIKGSKELRPHFDILSGTNIVYSKASGRTSFIKPLGSDSERLDGLNPFTAIFDEVHAISDRNIIDVIEGAFGARTNYHTVCITTAGINRHGVCYEQREQVCKILNKHFQNERVFGIIYTLDEGEEDDWTNPKLWLKCNPSLGHGKQLEFMEKQCLGAKQVPSQLNDFLTKQLCVWVDAKSSWLSAEDWAKCETTQLPDLKGKKCIIGLDLAAVNDLCGLSLYFPIQPGLTKPVVISKAHLPEEGLAEKEHLHGVPYSSWKKSGFVTTNPGKTNDFDFIKVQILAFAKLYKVEVSYDRNMSYMLIPDLEKEGVKCHPHQQNFFGMNAPTLELERMVINQGITIEKNPCLAWQAGNVVLIRDSSDNVKPNKDKDNNKIDALVALIMAIGWDMNQKKETKKVADPSVRISFG